LLREKDSAVLALHIGTSKLVALRASFKPDKTIVVESWKKIDAQGFEKGLVRDSEVATQEVKEILAEVAGEKPYYEFPLYTVVSNPEIRNYQVSSSLYFQGTKTIHEQDIQNVVRQTKTVATIPLDEVILSTVPQEYLVNDLPEIKNPLGLEGKRLSVTLHLFTLPITAYRGLTLLLDRLEIESEVIIPKGLTSSTMVLHEEEKNEGALLVEIGGHLSELFYFYQGSLKFSKILSWGSENITEQLALKWEIPPKDARRFKEEFGSLEESAHALEESIPYTDASGRVRLKIPLKIFQEEILKNMDAGLEILGTEIREVKNQYPHLYQLVFSGGCTKMNGFLELAQGKLTLPCRLGFGTGIQGPQELLAHPAYNAILGLLKYVSNLEAEGGRKPESLSLLSKTVNQVKGWIQDYF